MIGNGNCGRIERAYGGSALVDGAVVEGALARRDELKPRPQSPAKAPSARPYYLEVSLEIGPQSINSFFALAPTVRTYIESKTKLRMVAAAQSPLRTQLFHLWEMDSADALRDGMMKLVDSTAYARLDRLVARERQDFSSPIGWIPNPRPSAKGRAYARVAGHLATKDLAEFQAIYEVYPQRLARNGLYFWGAFMNISGRVNRVTSLWVVDTALKDDTLAKLPGLSLLDGATVDYWPTAPYDPS